MEKSDLKIGHSRQRLFIAMLFTISIAIIFWSFSRYPDLVSEYHRAQDNTLIERQLGPLSKDEAINTTAEKSNMLRAVETALNWIDTNKIGMSFGMIFSAALLLLLEQSVFLSRRAAKRGLSGVISGLMIGTPLGLCTNCATPVSLGLKKSGASFETAFTTIVASPSLNIIALAIIYFLFPASLFIFRVLAILLFLCLILPLLIHCFVNKTQRVLMPDSPLLAPTITENWFSSIKYCVYSYWQYFLMIIKKVLPPMLIIGFIAAMIVTYFPPEKLLILPINTVFAIIVAGILGTLLPLPMLMDILLVWLLLTLGLPMSIATTLIITLAPTSLFSLYIMGKNVSWPLSIAVSTGICLLGIFCGLLVHYYFPQHQITNGPQFEVIKTLPVTKTFDNQSLSHFFAAGISTIDMDNDGLIDIYLPGDQQSLLLKNMGDGQFSDISQQTGIDQTQNTVAGIWADYDGDGDLDLYQVNYQHQYQPQANKLFRQNADGTFTDVSQQVGLTDRDFSSSAAWADVDNDGDLDLFVSNYGFLQISSENTIQGESRHDRLYRNDHGKFTDITKKAGVAGQAIVSSQIRQIEVEEIPGDRGFSFQPVWFDYNNDGWIDLFVTADFGTSQLYKNKGDGTFSNVTKDADLFAFGTGMGVAVIDINQDGFFDLYTTTTSNNQLWLNKQDGRFENIAQSLALNDVHRVGWGVAEFDINNDGDNELYVVNGAVIYSGIRQTEYEATLAKVINSNRLLMKTEHYQFINYDQDFAALDYAMGRGLAIADFNRDGQIDFAISNREDNRLLVYQNKGHANAYIQIKLLGAAKNLQAIGAKVAVITKDKTQYKLVSAGSSFLSQHSHVLHFGLGDAKKIEKIIITWPDGSKKIMKNVKPNQMIEIKQD